MSYLSSAKCWARRNKATIYGLQRDQMKGFDHLLPQGFYDAITSYGLPTAIINLDCGAQFDTCCYICMAHGVTEPIRISGVTKQGGSLSPVKSTLTTSPGHHHPNDLLANDPDALIITSTQVQKADPHLPDDNLHMLVGMVEATDNSHLFSRTQASLCRNVLAMEQFQFAYGWTTNWGKSIVFVLKPSGTPLDTANFDSITVQAGVNPLTISIHTVKLVAYKFEFLRAKVDDPKTRHDQLRAFIDDFTFPKFIRRAPITLLRKIIKQNMISKARTLLSLQPIS
jgi:hypothetical protein